MRNGSLKECFDLARHFPMTPFPETRDEIWNGTPCWQSKFEASTSDVVLSISAVKQTLREANTVSYRCELETRCDEVSYGTHLSEQGDHTVTYHASVKIEGRAFHDLLENVVAVPRSPPESSHRTTKYRVFTV